MQNAINQQMLRLQGDLPGVVRKIAMDYTKPLADEAVPAWMSRAGKAIVAKHGKDPVVLMDWGTRQTLVTSLSIVKHAVDQYLKECRNVPVQTHPIRIGAGKGTVVEFPYGALIKVLVDADRMVEDAAEANPGRIVLRVLTVCSDRRSCTARTAWL